MAGGELGSSLYGDSKRLLEALFSPHGVVSETPEATVALGKAVSMMIQPAPSSAWRDRSAPERPSASKASRRVWDVQRKRQALVSHSRTNMRAVG